MEQKKADLTSRMSSRLIN
ncbi:hypothetical protein CAEBREN_22999 [Caenorhabditis brenneri]|uniref:Uncharacterized protein n=1 Tax=Caenorhabditis brenneri TaxID=135651 RepID=G0MNS5_CAEBE|nr:hypothetical protein CAEBREN_22999 [Caenorhabditis brenneri]